MASERAGSPWTSEDRAFVKEWIAQLPEGYTIKGSDYDDLAKDLGRSPGAIRLHIFSNAAVGAPDRYEDILDFTKLMSVYFHINDTELLKYITKRNNEKNNGIKIDHPVVLRELSELHAKVDRLTIIISRLEAKLSN